MTDALPPPHVVDSALCSGEVHDHGAQVTRWAPTGAEPVLYVSTAVVLQTGHAIRGGIPVCWPWFGPGRRAGMTPSHGFVRTAAWELIERVDDTDAVTFVHRITSEVATSAHFPHPYAVELRSRFGATLEVSLTTTNTGTSEFDYEEALHAYLAVGDVREVKIVGLDGITFLDKVTGSERIQEGTLVLDGEIDSVYRTSGPVTLHDPVLGRRLEVSAEGTSDVVVWNPWQVKAREVEDIGDDDWQRFVCIEAGNVLENAVSLQAGESHTATYRLAVNPA